MVATRRVVGMVIGMYWAEALVGISNGIAGFG